MHFLVPFSHLLTNEKESWSSSDLGSCLDSAGLSEHLWGSGSTSWPQLCILDLFSHHVWFRNWTLFTPKAAVSGLFSVVIRGIERPAWLHDGNFQKTLCHHTCHFQVEPERLWVKRKARMEKARRASGQGDLLSCLLSFEYQPRSAAFPRSFSQKHT